MTQSIISTKPVSIQGYEGSFHQLAARHFFGRQVEVLPCDTFREVVKTAKSGVASAAVMAIENSIAGSILPNYQLIKQSGLRVMGEVFLQIRQHLMVNPGVKLEDIKEVHSHHMALQQCLQYLDGFHWKLVETEDTALSAKHIRQHRMKHAAAIAGRLAAELYGMEIIAPNIHTMKQNYTRFLLLSKDTKAPAIKDADKASIQFQTNHTRGSLAKVLTVIAEGGINLSKLQSFPIPGSDFKYQFHADMEFESIGQYQQVMEKIQNLTEEVKVYGVYKRGEWLKE
jgi:prephenate dehydratase